MSIVPLKNEIESSVMMTPVDSNVSMVQDKIGQALYDHIYRIDHDTCELGDEDSFFVCDLDEVKRLYMNWCFKLPRVKPFYAVKCNNDPNLLQTLIELGCNFDCASKGEITQMLKLGVSPNRIIYANPCKSSSFIRFANQQDINLTTFDNSDELWKLHKYHPNSKILIRIITDDSNAQCRLSTKFGCSMDNVENLLKLSQFLKLDVAGVAFHIGSGSSDLNSIDKAIRDSKTVFQIASKLGIKMDILDIGGGFDSANFDISSQLVNHALESQFPHQEFPSLQIIAEPGRYMCSTLFTLACHVIAKRNSFEPETGEESNMIYLNDGVYGNLNCIIYDHQFPIAKTLTHNNNFYYADTDTCQHDVSIWGPTCDGLDCISNSTMLKFIPQVGDWLYFQNIGAYTLAASTPFNGFKQISEVKYV